MKRQNKVPELNLYIITAQLNISCSTEIRSYNCFNQLFFKTVKN
jgi:hypothetical protein